MTQDEQDKAIADMVRERREVRRTIACLEQQISRAGDGFRQATEATRSAKRRNPGQRIHFPKEAAYPDIEAFRGILRGLEEATLRLSEIEKALDSC